MIVNVFDYSFYVFTQLFLLRKCLQLFFLRYNSLNLFFLKFIYTLNTINNSTHWLYIYIDISIVSRAFIAHDHNEPLFTPWTKHMLLSFAVLYHLNASSCLLFNTIYVDFFMSCYFFVAYTDIWLWYIIMVIWLSYNKIVSCPTEGGWCCPGTPTSSTTINWWQPRNRSILRKVAFFTIKTKT